MHGSMNIKSISCNSYTILFSLPSSTEVKYIWSHTSAQSILLRGVQRNAYYFVFSPYYYSNRDSSVGIVSRQRPGKTKHLFFSIPGKDTRFFCYLKCPCRFGDRYIFNVTRLTLRRLMSYIYGARILDVSRSHTTTQHSR